MAFGISTLFTGVAGALSAIVIGFVAPESFGLFLSLSFLVGSAVGGIATIGGAIVGEFFIEFVPNFASDISDAAPWAIYGLAMLLLMYAMPRGVVGSLGPWLARRWSGKCSRTVPKSNLGRDKTRGGCYDSETDHGGRPVRRRLLLQPLHWPTARANTDPAPATPRSRSATPMPYSGPASSYGIIGKAEDAYFDMINKQGGINGRKITFISRDDGYSPPKTVELAAPAGRAGPGAVAVLDTRHTAQHGDRRLRQRKQGAAPVSRRPRHQWNDPEHSVDDDVVAELSTEVHIYASYVLKNFRTPRSRCCIRTTITARIISTACATASATRPAR